MLYSLRFALHHAVSKMGSQVTVTDRRTYLRLSGQCRLSCVLKLFCLSCVSVSFRGTDGIRGLLRCVTSVPFCTAYVNRNAVSVQV